MRFSLLIALLIAVFTIGAPAGLQASVGPNEPGTHDFVVNTERAADSARSELRGKKPGCRRFCQQAGGFGECPGTQEVCNPVEMPDQTVGGTRDQIVAIQATCTLDHDCLGALILTSFKGDFGSADFPGEYGRADLEIPAGETRKVKVGISKKGLEYLKKHDGDKSAFATAPLIPHDPPDPASISGDIILLKP